MLTINATDAQELQKAGISPDEYLGIAVGRIQDAIVDRARKGHPGVDVIVYNISLEQVPIIMNALWEQDFKATSDEAYNDKPNKVFKISWN